MQVLKRIFHEINLHLVVLFWLSILTVFAYIASTKIYSNKAFTIIIVSWIFIFVLRKKNFSVGLFYLFFFFLVASPLLYPLDLLLKTFLSEKAAVLASLFLAIGSFGYFCGMVRNQIMDHTFFGAVREFLDFTELDQRYPKFYMIRLRVRVFLWRLYGPIPKNTQEMKIFAPRALLTVLIILIVTTTYNIIHTHQIRESRKPSVQDIQPHYVYRALKVVVYGKNMGFKPSESDLRIMSQYGEIQKDEWTDKKIVFTVPLTWKDGPVHIWVEKPVEWGGVTEIISSKTIDIKLIPTTEKFTPDDDEFFKDLPKLKKEVRDINGYN